VAEPFPLEAYLQDVAARVEGELRRALDAGARGGPARLWEAMRYAVLGGGKRVRPALCCATAEAFGADAGEGSLALRFGAALEMIHAYSLVHDDLPAMDDDDLRRGRPSCHRAFGEAAAILAGDGLLTLAFETMAAARVPNSLLAAKQEAMRAVGGRAGVRGMIGGQWLDISLVPEKASRRALDVINSKKTGALILGAVEAGALLGRAGAADRQAMADYGKNIGLAFQVRDDILDSGGGAAGGRPARPDQTALYGLAGSRARLTRLVGEAVGAIDRFKERGAELRYLAGLLLDAGRRAQDA